MIRKAGKNDAAVVAGLAVLMWNDSSVEELINDFEGISCSEDAQVFLIYEEDIPVGFAQCQLRHDYVEGTETSPVGYLEGIFIKEGYRHQGYARKLLYECEKWALEKGCMEFASDCETDNGISLQFHMAAGFTESNRIICFAKKLK